MKNILKNESTSGIILLIFAVIAIVIANSGLNVAYDNILHTNISIGYKEFSLSMSVLHWINDGLMVIFFLVVGMEIKREVVFGELKSFKKAILPISAAIGGMIVPTIIYMLFNFNKPTSGGFGIPMATDIAFALGILSLVGKKAPKGIVVFLTALATVDDLGAIIVIAIFYTSKISWIAFIMAIVVIGMLLLASKSNVKHPAIYIILGVVLWICFLKSGIHSTIAGVILGLLLPIGKTESEVKTSILNKFEHKLAPWSSFVIMPIFALANAGITIDISDLSSTLFTPVSFGIIFGLILGKQIGIFGVSYLLVKFKIANLPYQVSKRHLYGASVLGGIGFTMSIFVSSLSFSDETMLSTAKIAIILASVLSAVLGAIIFKGINYESKKVEKEQKELELLVS